MSKGICSIEDCQTRHYGKSYCNLHYKRWRKYGDPLRVRLPQSAHPCSIEDCELPGYVMKMCSKHYTRFLRYGDPLARLAGDELAGCYICVGCGQDRPGSEFSVPGKSACRECASRRRTARVTFGRLDHPYHCAGCGEAFLGTAAVHSRYCTPLCRVRNGDHNSRRKALLLAAPTEVIDRLRVFVDDGWICGICSTAIEPSLQWPDPLSASLDHVIPLAAGGHHVLTNAQAAHLRCNMSKGARLPDMTI